MRTWRPLLAVFVAAFAPIGCGTAFAAPAQIILLRHAEKPAVGSELNERGRERATALVNLFTHDARVLEHGPAVAIFAMRPHGKSGSVRAIQTMEPTARALGVALDAQLTRDEITPLAHAILSAPACEGKTVIVCWEHDAIPKIVKALGWTTGPSDWPSKAYDRLWVLDFDHGKPVRFRDLPQQILPGDKTK